MTPLEQIKDKAFRAMVLERSDSLTRKLANDIMQRARDRAALEAEAGKLGNALTPSPAFELTDDVPALGRLVEAKTELPQMKPGQVGRNAAKTFGGYAVWMLDQVLPPEPRPYERVRPQVTQRLEKDSMDVLLRGRVDTLMTRLRWTDNLGDAAYDLGTVRDSDPFVRGFFISGLGAASLVDSFIATAKPGQISGTLKHPSGGYVVAQYLGADPVDAKDLEARRQQIRETLVQKPEAMMLAELRRKARVRIFRPELKDAWNPSPQGGSPAAGRPAP
ncbi:MAG: hypothetical protein HZB25_05440 [Candidatus Eisenbacteria bacterium]|nr:hypothetical protein [Candidatus Eisenbacteria bacterium]